MRSKLASARMRSSDAVHEIFLAQKRDSSVRELCERRDAMLDEFRVRHVLPHGVQNQIQTVALYNRLHSVLVVR